MIGIIIFWLLVSFIVIIVEVSGVLVIFER